MKSLHFPLVLFFAFFSGVNSLGAQDFYGNAIQEVRIEIPHKNWDFKLDSLKKASRARSSFCRTVRILSG